MSWYLDSSHCCQCLAVGYQSCINIKFLSREIIKPLNNNPNYLMTVSEKLRTYGGAYIKVWNLEFWRRSFTYWGVFFFFFNIINYVDKNVFSTQLLCTYTCYLLFCFILLLQITWLKSGACFHLRRRLWLHWWPFTVPTPPRLCVYWKTNWPWPFRNTPPLLTVLLCIASRAGL